MRIKKWHPTILFLNCQAFQTAILIHRAWCLSHWQYTTPQGAVRWYSIPGLISILLPCIRLLPKLISIHLHIINCSWSTTLRNNGSGAAREIDRSRFVSSKRIPCSELARDKSPHFASFFSSSITSFIDLPSTQPIFQASFCPS